MSSVSVSKFGKLLMEFKKIPFEDLDDLTFMEIAGYPHYENVCSNILSFYLDSSLSHGFSDLLLRSLVGDDEYLEGMSSNMKVEREVSTAANKRIDILIETDTHIIAIENKIFHSINNPFDDYRDYVGGLNNDNQKTTLLILLGLKICEADEVSGFKPLSYGTFFSRIRLRIGEHLSAKNQRYLFPFLDFMATIENLNEESSTNSELIAFFDREKEDITLLIKTVNDFKKGLRMKAKALGELINIENFSVKQWLWTLSTADLFHTLVHDVEVSEGIVIAVDTTISASGWKFEIFMRSGGDNKMLRDFLSSCQIEFEEIQREYGHRFVHKTRFAHSENLAVVSPHLQGILNQITRTDFPLR